jgi:hypothetical protein
VLPRQALPTPANSSSSVIVMERRAIYGCTTCSMKAICSARGSPASNTMTQ